MCVCVWLQAPGVVGAYFGMVDGGLVERLHQRGKKIYVWTVNEVREKGAP